MERKTSAKKISENEIENLVVDLAKKGLTAEKIGLVLRDQHGWQKDKTKVKISKILEKNDLYVQPDISNLEQKISSLRDHMETHKQDKKAKRELVKLEARIKKLRKKLE